MEAAAGAGHRVALSVVGTERLQESGYLRAKVPDPGYFPPDIHQSHERGKMPIPTGDNEFMYELELNVREELTVAESSPLGEESDGRPAVEWLLDPDALRYEVSLRTLLGAIEAMEDYSP